ncbi:hypothetical protein [Saccharopolyspora gloriosae]|uniref:hypothetical protein n=1 Tax=Saccharopolyspora gloriosae TaxID=455344 RepID=UPI001FB6C93E|nr:hypothetical protein [Saccharopolyspora gloriosae]
MTQVGAGGAFGDERREFVDETPTPPMGMSWSGSLLTEGAGAPEPERATQSVAVPDERATSPSVRGELADAAARGSSGAETDRAGAEEAPTDPGSMGLAELLAAEDLGRAGPAVLGADNSGDVSGDAGDWPTLQRRERQEQQDRGGALGWIRRRR